MSSEKSELPKPNVAPEISPLGNEAVAALPQTSDEVVSAAAANPAPNAPLPEENATKVFLNALSKFISINNTDSDEVVTKAVRFMEAISKPEPEPEPAPAPAPEPEPESDLEPQPAPLDVYKPRKGIVIISDLKAVSRENLAPLIHAAGARLRQVGWVIEYTVLAVINVNEMPRDHLSEIRHQNVNVVEWCRNEPFMIGQYFRFDPMSELDRLKWLESIPLELQNYTDYLNPTNNECVLFLDNGPALHSMIELFASRQEKTNTEDRAWFAFNDCARQLPKAPALCNQALTYSDLIRRDRQRRTLLTHLVSMKQLGAPPENRPQNDIQQAIINGELELVVKMVADMDKSDYLDSEDSSNTDLKISNFELACMYKQKTIAEYFLKENLAQLTPYTARLLDLADKTKTHIFLDWQNIHVSVNFVAEFIRGIDAYAKVLNFHGIYSINGQRNFDNTQVTAFLDITRVQEVAKLLRSVGVNIAHIDGLKNRAADSLIENMMEQTVKPGDSILLVSGDRDFSSTLASFQNKGCPIGLIYNHQAWVSIKTNPHWFGAVDYLDLPKLETVKQILDSRGKQKPTNSAGKKVADRTKACNFYQDNTCRFMRSAGQCNFQHICANCQELTGANEPHPKLACLKPVNTQDVPHIHLGTLDPSPNVELSTQIPGTLDHLTLNLLSEQAYEFLKKLNFNLTYETFLIKDQPSASESSDVSAGAEASSEDAVSPVEKFLKDVFNPEQQPCFEIMLKCLDSECSVDDLLDTAAACTTVGIAMQRAKQENQALWFLNLSLCCSIKAKNTDYEYASKYNLLLLGSFVNLRDDTPQNEYSVWIPRNRMIHAALTDLDGKCKAFLAEDLSPTKYTRQNQAPHALPQIIAHYRTSLTKLHTAMKRDGKSESVVHDGSEFWETRVVGQSKKARQRQRKALEKLNNVDETHVEQQDIARAKGILFKNPKPRICSMCNERPRYVEGHKLLPFCGRDCLNKYSVNIYPMCLNCDVKPRIRQTMPIAKDHLFCSTTCAKSFSVPWDEPLKFKPVEDQNDHEKLMQSLSFPNSNANSGESVSTSVSSASKTARQESTVNRALVSSSSSAAASSLPLLPSVSVQLGSASSAAASSLPLRPPVSVQLGSASSSAASALPLRPPVSVQLGSASGAAASTLPLRPPVSVQLGSASSGAIPMPSLSKVPAQLSPYAQGMPAMSAPLLSTPQGFSQLNPQQKPFIPGSSSSALSPRQSASQPFVSSGVYSNLNPAANAMSSGAAASQSSAQQWPVNYAHNQAPSVLNQHNAFFSRSSERLKEEVGLLLAKCGPKIYNQYYFDLFVFNQLNGLMLSRVSQIHELRRFGIEDPLDQKLIFRILCGKSVSAINSPMQECQTEHLIYWVYTCPPYVHSAIPALQENRIDGNLFLSLTEAELSILGIDSFAAGFLWQKICEEEQAAAEQYGGQALSLQYS